MRSIFFSPSRFTNSCSLVLENDPRNPFTQQSGRNSCRHDRGACNKTKMEIREALRPANIDQSRPPRWTSSSARVRERVASLDDDEASPKGAFFPDRAVLERDETEWLWPRNAFRRTDYFRPVKKTLSTSNRRATGNTRVCEREHEDGFHGREAPGVALHASSLRPRISSEFSPNFLRALDRETKARRLVPTGRKGERKNARRNSGAGQDLLKLRIARG